MSSWCLACLRPSPPDPTKPPVESTMVFKTTLSLPLPPFFFFRPVLVFVVFFLVLGGIRVPSESLFVERDDHLRTLHVGLLCRHQVSFIWVFPAKTEKTTQKRIQHLARAEHIWIPSQHRQLHGHWYSSFQQLPSVYDAYKPFHEEHEFSCGICGTDNPFWSQASSEAPQLLCLRIKRQNATSVKLKTTSLHKC